MLLAFMCEGECEIDEGQLTEVFAIGESAWRKSGRMQKMKSKAPYGSRTHFFRLRRA